MEQSLENLLRDLELYLEENWNGSDEAEAEISPGSETDSAVRPASTVETGSAVLPVIAAGTDQAILPNVAEESIPKGGGCAPPAGRRKSSGRRAHHRA